MKKPLVSELRTFAVVQTNAPKILYGSGVVGAGFKDVYYDYRTVRGKFVQKNTTRALEDGSVIPITLCQYIVRYDTALMGVIDLQVRFAIRHRGVAGSVIYTLLSWDVEEFDKESYFVFDLSEYGK